MVILSPKIPYIPNYRFPGYILDSLSENQLGNGFTAQLNLAGPPCNAFGSDILNLTIQVTYETNSRCVCILIFSRGPYTYSIVPRLHVNIFDTSAQQFTLPSGYFDLPKPGEPTSPVYADLQFNYEASPFAFWITRRSDPDSVPIFDTRLTSLPPTPIPRARDDTSPVFDGFPLVFEDRYLQVS